MLIPGHTKQLTSKRWDARIPGCDNECRAVKTKFLSGVDTNGCGVPVAVSQMTMSPENGAVTPANVWLNIVSTQQAQDHFAESVPLFPS